LAAHVMLFDDSPSWCRAMRTALIAQSFSVAASPNLASARDSAAARPPDVVIVNMDLGLAAQDALRAIRQAAPHVGVLVLSATDQPDVLAHQHKAQAGRTKDVSLLELAHVVQSIHAANQKRETKHPNLQTLARLVAIWLGRRSGTVSTATSAVPMADGSPLMDDDHAVLRKALFHSAEINFTPGPPCQHPDSDRFGELLFKAAKTSANPAFMMRQKNRSPQPMPETPRIKALNLHPDTRRLLRDGMGLRLGESVRNFGLDAETLGIELDALMRLGLIRLTHQRHPSKQTAMPAPSRAAPPPKLASPTRGQSPKKKQDANLDALMVLKRLRKELPRLENADPWTVLGIAPTTDPKRIQVAAKRMRDRYRALRENPDLSDTIHEIASKIERRVAEAALKADPKDAVEDDSPKDQRMFKEAMKQVKQEQFSQAARLLRAAHRIQVYEPKYQAWLGYCLAQDAKQLPQAARATVRAEASELLQLAVQLSDVPEWKLWLLEVLIEEKELDKAGRVLRILLRDAPDIQGLSSAANALQALTLPPS